MSQHGSGPGHGHQGGQPGPGGYEAQFNQAYGINQQGGYGGQEGRGQSRGYGAPPNAYGGMAGVLPPRQQKGTTGPRILTFIGIGLVVLAIVGAGIAASRLAGIVGDFEILTVSANSPTSITVEAGEERALYSSSSTNPQLQTQGCTVTGPDGAPVTLTSPSGSVTINDYALGHRFTASQTGAYTVTCPQQTYVGQSVSAGELVGSIGGLAAAIIGGVLGLILAIIGGFWWASRRS